MVAYARRADIDDLPTLLCLYRLLEAEMEALSPMWRLTSGLIEPADQAIRELVEASLAGESTCVLLGGYEAVPFGFMVGTIDEMLPQAGDHRLGSIRLLFVDVEARAVGIGEALRDHMLDWFRMLGISRFDAHVLPGHRLAKNFFEQGGFSARHIIMHHDDER